MRKRICVLGACNYDLVGRCVDDYRNGDASEGSVRLQSGGVARNIAQGLYHAGHDVELISVLGEDVFGKELGKEMEKQGYSFHAIKRPKSDLFLGLETKEGELHSALADMRGIESLRFHELPQEVLERADAFVVDCCLSEEFLREFFMNCSHKKIYVDGVSMDRVGRIAPFLHQVHILKINRQEASVLTGLADPVKAAKDLVDRGVQGVLLSLGEEGVLYRDKEGQLTLKKVADQVVSTLGAGDALFSGFVSAEIEERDLQEALEKALDSAVATLHVYDSWKGKTYE